MYSDKPNRRIQKVNKKYGVVNMTYTVSALQLYDQYKYIKTQTVEYNVEINQQNAII